MWPLCDVTAYRRALSYHRHSSFSAAHKRPPTALEPVKCGMRPKDRSASLSFGVPVLPLVGRGILGSFNEMFATLMGKCDWGDLGAGWPGAVFGQKTLHE